MWIRTFCVLTVGNQVFPANTRLEVDAHIGRLLVRRGQAETITVVDEAAMTAVLTPDQSPQKNVEK